MASVIKQSNLGSEIVDLAAYMQEMGQAARAASRVIAAASTQQKSAALQAIAAATDAARDEIKAANALDMASAQENQIDQPLIDRLF